MQAYDLNSGVTLGGFGGVAGFFALYFFSDVPRVRKDILQVSQMVGKEDRGIGLMGC